MTATPDYLPLSFLNQLLYCPRRFWLMYIQSEWEDNAPVLEGIFRHKNAHDPGTQRDEFGRSQRSVHLWSDSLRIIGVADFIEERNGSLTPLEHKRGRMGNWLNDHVQLCAQAMCLEERLNSAIQVGEIFYWTNRRREKVTLDEALRERTRATVHQAFHLIEAGRMPAPIENDAKCRDCSLEPICLPRETRRMLKEDGK